MRLVCWSWIFCLIVSKCFSWTCSTQFSRRTKTRRVQQHLLQQVQYGRHFMFLHQLSLLHVAASQTDFDFSCTRAWETFYQQQDDDVTEWHSSISMQTLVDLIPKSNEKKKNKQKLLMIGCGTSQLPTFIQSQRSNDIEMTLLDSSSTCIEQLKKRYGNKMRYICGDATQLSSACMMERYNYIYDKGLLDALLCNEGWNTPVSRLFHEASYVLVSPPPSSKQISSNDGSATTTTDAIRSSNSNSSSSSSSSGNVNRGTTTDTTQSSSSNGGGDGGGLYILVSYPLPTSTRSFLVEQGNMVGLNWEFDVGLSLPNYNNTTGSSSDNAVAAARVSISIAQKIS